MKQRLIAIFLIIFGIALGYADFASVYAPDRFLGSLAYKLGLDLQGGIHLVYLADTSKIATNEINEAMAGLRDVIERRVNLFGVSEPIVQTEVSSALAGTSEQRLIVELPGVTDTQKAIELIGQTPVLEFRMLKQEATIPTDMSATSINAAFEPSAITGKDLTSAQLQFQGGPGSLNSAVVVLQFNSEGARIFADLTKENVGRNFGIFLDGTPISVPVIQEAIPDGTAVISGNFTPESAKELARDLNYGALPVPITLISTQTVSGTLGEEAVQSGVFAGIFGIGAVALFMVLWYRLPGLLAGIALSVYIVVMLALFKFIPVTLTAAGIAAFILSIGMAVDANILIFERTKEELRVGKGAQEAIREGFHRAWLSIRDSNISSMITAVILFWFGTSLIQGFALVFGLGVLVSMLTAILVSRTFLLALGINGRSGFTRFLLGSGVKS